MSKDFSTMNIVSVSQSDSVSQLKFIEMIRNGFVRVTTEAE